MSIGTDFFDRQFTIFYTGGSVSVAGTCDVGGVVVADDELRITTAAGSFSHDYSNGCGAITAAGPHDVTSLFTPGTNVVRVQGTERCGGGSGMTDMFFVYQLQCAFRTRTGNGYAGLTSEMKAALDRLYAALEAVDACYHFNIGARTQQYQDGLRKRWHDIADKPAGDTRSAAKIKKQLKNAGFAQKPEGYKPPDAQGLRVAKGGPAKKSRHTEGQAADLTVLFPTARDLAKYRDAARKAGLCGPTTGDPVHVELPYKRKDRAHPRRKLFRCHFPEGPAP